jgi:hypothetical protein
MDNSYCNINCYKNFGTDLLLCIIYFILLSMGMPGKGKGKVFPSTGLGGP